jgi:hypothetical protein
MWQPHGSLLITGAKPFETRHWKTDFRGPLMIHAAQRFVRWEFDVLFRFKNYQIGLSPLIGLPLNFRKPAAGNISARAIIDNLALGAFIGVVDLVDCIATERMTPAQIKAARGFGDFRPGRFAWHVRNVRRFLTPIPARGRQGFFNGFYNPEKDKLVDVQQTEEARALRVPDCLF